MESKYGTFRLKKETIEYLQRMKQAFEMCYGKPFSNDGFIMQMAKSVEDGDEGVWETFCELTEELDAIKQRARDRMKS